MTTRMQPLMLFWNIALGRLSWIIGEVVLYIGDVDPGKARGCSTYINGILFNSEAWHGVTAAHIVRFESVDEALLKGILNAYNKTPTEFVGTKTEYAHNVDS